MPDDSDDLDPSLSLDECFFSDLSDFSDFSFEDFDDFFSSPLDEDSEDFFGMAHGKKT